MDITDTIYCISDSIKVISHHAAETHGLGGYMAEHFNTYYNSDAPQSDWFVVSNLGITGFLIAIALIALFLLWLVAGPRKIKDWINSRSLKWPFIIVWLFGFAVYDVGMCTGEMISLITNAPMAILYAFKIFLFDSDVSEIHGAFHESWVYSLCFALAHFCAAGISTLFLIKLFGFNIVQSFRMLWASRKLWNKDVSESFIFWGFNEPSYCLIESINEHFGNNSSYRVIVIRTNVGEGDANESTNSFSKIFNFLSLPSVELERLRQTKCLTDCRQVNLSVTKIKDDKYDIFGKTLKMKSLRRLLKKRTSQKIHMFFLSDDEKDNLHNIELFLKDSTLQDFADENNPEKQVILYCHARHNSVHRVVEDRNPSDKIKVKVVDSSHISVEMLKQDEDLLPVKYVDVMPDATVSSAFNALVVGFSEVGQDSVRFLYEFGAFVATGSTDDHVTRSAFHLDVVDRQMSDLAGVFVANAPSIQLSVPFIKGEDNPSALITLHEMDCRSIEFYLKLKDEWIRKLNYVVIATEDDELNVSLGVRIFKLATRYREDLDDFCVLVRTHNDQNDHISEIVAHYNRLWAAQKAVPTQNGRAYVQTTVKRNETFNGPLHIFGLDKSTYTFKNIVDDSLEKNAVEFKERYEASTTLDYVKPKNENDKAWYVDFKKKMLIGTDYYPSLCGLQTLRRMQGQDLANSLHSLTKKYLAKKAISSAGVPDFDWTLLSRKYESVSYVLTNGGKVNPQIIRIINVLAQTEHLRWNASHEILGYTRDGESPSRHEIKLHHSCLTAWENLTSYNKSFDYNVVDVTLGVLDPENPIKK